ncbi:MAG: FeoC-like transcriptional regulator [Candidatus Bathyarchaeota archaeon]|nr:FeoC-like transcriptional regulator [Candidatus Bathyarchaeota archaeon]
MMKEILRQIRDIGVANTSEIAETIGISQLMVEQALAVLQSKGYLENVKNPKDSGCVTCTGCNYHCERKQPHSSTFLITEKGKQYLNRNKPS